MSPDPFPSGSPFGDPALPPTEPEADLPLTASTAGPSAAAYPPVAAVPPRSPARRRLPAVLAGVAGAVLVAGVGFAGGYSVGQGAAPSPSTLRGAGGPGNGFTFPGGSFGPGSGGRGFGGGGAAGAGTAGTISSVAPDQLTVTQAGGGSKLILVDGSTTVTKISSNDEALTDLSQGEQVTVVGTTNPDGSVTATQIVVGDVTGLFGGGSRRNAGGSPPPTAVP